MDNVALAAGAIRLSSGISFLVSPEKANKLWGDKEPPSATAKLLLRSMGYRDALIGGLLISTATRGRDTRGWMLASGGADLADFVGGLSVRDRLPTSQKLIGLVGAGVGVGIGLWGGLRSSSG